MILRLENLRLWRSRRPYLAAFGLAFFLVLMLVGFYTYAQTKTSGGADFGYTYENRSYFNGLTFALYAFYFGFLLLLPVFVCTEGGVQVAGDTSSGALHMLLTRPLSRARLFLAKLALSMALAAGITGLLLGLALVLGLFAVGWGDLDLYPGVLQMTDRRQHLEQSEALVRFLLAWPAATLALAVPLTFSLWISTHAKSAVNAVGTSVSIYLVLYVVAEIHFFQELRPWLFTSYMPYWRGLFREELDWTGLVKDASKLAGFACLFAALAFRRFRSREEA